MKKATFAVMLFALPAAARVYILNGDAQAWQQACAGVKMECETLALKDVADQSLLAIEQQVKEPGYLVAVGANAPAGLYIASRMPHLWNAIVVAGVLTPALQTNRLFAANFKDLPVLWVGPDKSDLERLERASFPVQTREKATVGEILQWLGQQHRDADPAEIDCESGDPNFVRCYWLKVEKFDPKLRNDVLPSSRVPAELKPKVNAKLQPGDKVVSVGGKTPDDFLNSVKDNQPVVLMVERGKERVRLEGNVVIPIAEEVTTMRIQATYNVEQHAIQIISRLVSELQVQVPADWAPASVNWNGNEGRKLEAGCWSLALAADAVKVDKCQ